MGPARLPWSMPRHQGFRLALAGCLVAVTVLALIPPGHEPVSAGDKVNHIAAFLVLAWLADHAYPGYSRGPGLWLLLLGYGLLIEVLQAFVPYREASIGDLVADGIGLAGYWVLVRLPFTWPLRDPTRSRMPDCKILPTAFVLPRQTGEARTVCLQAADSKGLIWRSPVAVKRTTGPTGPSQS